MDVFYPTLDSLAASWDVLKKNKAGEDFKEAVPVHRVDSYRLVNFARDYWPVATRNDEKDVKHQYLADPLDLVEKSYLISYRPDSWQLPNRLARCSAMSSKPFEAMDLDCIGYLFTAHLVRTHQVYAPTAAEILVQIVKAREEIAKKTENKSVVAYEALGLSPLKMLGLLPKDRNLVIFDTDKVMGGVAVTGVVALYAGVFSQKVRKELNQIPIHCRDQKFAGLSL